MTDGLADDGRGSSILVVDDDPENLRLLVAVLKHGCLVPRPVLSGSLAIEAAVIEPPDLVLLDISMPEMSGLDVCRWFKKDERLQNLPIIFISGLQGTDDKVEAFRAGGIDYVSKPFQELEVLIRVKTHLRLRQVQAKLASHNTHLEPCPSAGPPPGERPSWHTGGADSAR
jgi:DNA-binding response OmpR family regulator